MCNNSNMPYLPDFISETDNTFNFLDACIILYCDKLLRKFFILFLKIFKRLKKKDLYKYNRLYNLYGSNCFTRQQAYTFIFLLKKQLYPTIEWTYSLNLNQKPFLYLTQLNVEALFGKDKLDEEKAVTLFKNLFLKSPSAQKELYQEIIYNLLDDVDFFYLYLEKFKKLVIRQLDEYKEAFDLEQRKKEQEEEKLKESYKRFLI